MEKGVFSLPVIFALIPHEFKSLINSAEINLKVSSLLLLINFNLSKINSLAGLFKTENERLIKKDENLILVTNDLRNKEKELKNKEEEQNRKDIDLKVREEEQKNLELKEKRRRERALKLIKDEEEKQKQLEKEQEETNEKK